jgi:hypothetical protein
MSASNPFSVETTFFAMPLLTSAALSAVRIAAVSSAESTVPRLRGPVCAGAATGATGVSASAGAAVTAISFSETLKWQLPQMVSFIRPSIFTVQETLPPHEGQNAVTAGMERLYRSFAISARTASHSSSLL